MSSPLLSKSGNCDAGYGEAEVLHGIDLSVSQGEFVCIIGANTAGKSTILRSISRLVPRSSGILRFDGVDLTALAAHEIPALGIAHVPEGRQVFPGHDGRGKSAARRLHRPQRPAICRRGSRTCSNCFRACASATDSLRERCRAASSRWSRSAAR